MKHVTDLKWFACFHRMSVQGVQVAGLPGTDWKWLSEPQDAVCGEGTGQQGPQAQGLPSVLHPQPRQRGQRVRRGRHRRPHQAADRTLWRHQMPLAGWEAQVVFHPSLPGRQRTERRLHWVRRTQSESQPQSKPGAKRCRRRSRFHSGQRRLPVGNGHPQLLCLLQGQDNWHLVHSDAVPEPCSVSAEVSGPRE